MSLIRNVLLTTHSVLIGLFKQVMFDDRLNLFCFMQDKRIVEIVCRQFFTRFYTYKVFTNQMLIFRTKTITTELSIPQELMLESALSEVFFTTGPIMWNYLWKECRARGQSPININTQSVLRKMGYTIHYNLENIRTSGTFVNNGTLLFLFMMLYEQNYNYSLGCSLQCILVQQMKRCRNKRSTC